MIKYVISQKQIELIGSAYNIRIQIAINYESKIEYTCIDAYIYAITQETQLN